MIISKEKNYTFSQHLHSKKSLQLDKFDFSILKTNLPFVIHCVYEWGVGLRESSNKRFGSCHGTQCLRSVTFVLGKTLPDADKHRRTFFYWVYMLRAACNEGKNWKRNPFPSVTRGRGGVQQPETPHTSTACHIILRTEPISPILGGAVWGGSFMYGSEAEPFQPAMGLRDRYDDRFR